MIPLEHDVNQDSRFYPLAVPVWLIALIILSLLVY
jgi:hypothetical protein